MKTETSRHRACPWDFCGRNEACTQTMNAFQGEVREEVHKTCYEFPLRKTPPPAERIREGFMSGGPPFRLMYTSNQFCSSACLSPCPLSVKPSLTPGISIWSLPEKRSVGVPLFPVAQIGELPDFTAQKYHLGNLFRMQTLGPSTGDAESGNLTSVMKPAYFFK